MPKITTDTRIKRERERLLEIFSELDEKRRNTAVSLIENAAFMTVTLEDLRKTISENGVVSEYQNGENQFGTKKSPEVEVYNTMIKNFTTIIKTLCDMLPSPVSCSPCSTAASRSAGKTAWSCAKPKTLPALSPS